MKTVMISVLIIGFGVLVILAGSCSKSDLSADSQVDKGNISASSGLINPAARKCIDDGFILKPVFKHGVPVKYLCINPETGLKCDVWEYFRNECSLSIKKSENRESGRGTDVTSK